MIVVDPSEIKFLESVIGSNSLEFLSVPHVEELTGADIVVTPLNKPFNQKFLADHIAAGCFLVQRKSGADLPNSVGDRMISSLTRMRATGARQSQCILLFIGTYKPTDKGFVAVDGMEIKNYGSSTFWFLHSAIEKWMECGGVFANISKPSLLPGWLMIKDKHAQKMLTDKTFVVYEPSPAVFETLPNDPLQEPVLIKDWRRTLMSIPDIGPKRLNALIDHLSQKGSATLIDCITYLTTWELLKTVPGFGKATCNKCRQWFGLDDLVIINFEVNEKEGNLE